MSIYHIFMQNIPNVWMSRQQFVILQRQEEDVRLIPVGFVNDNWKCDTTTNPNVFWAKP